jgi:predicted PurR-regulated permease PerM
VQTLGSRSDIPFLSQALSLDTLPESLSGIGANLLSGLLQFFSNSLAAFLQILFIVAIAVMMLFSPQAYRQSALRLFPSFYRRRADQILSQAELALGNWLTGVIINSLFIAALSGLGLWVLQIKLVLVHALMAGILNFIPNIGPAASVIFPLMIAVLDAPWKIVAVLFLYFVIQNIESYWLTPIVMAKQVSLLPAVTLIAQLLFASLFGLLGLLLALPLTVVAKTWIEEALFNDLLDSWQ